jgi:hypothetical protein
MAKTSSEERKPARKKIPSTKFPKAKRKIALAHHWWTNAD